MKTKILNYQVIVTPDEYPGGKACFNVYCPTLEISDYGDTVDKALANMREGIEAYVESLVIDKEEVPVDKMGMLYTQLSIPIKHNFQAA